MPVTDSPSSELGAVPSPRRPADYRAARRAAQCVADVIRAGQAPANDAFDRWLPDIDMIGFTGGTTTARSIAATAGKNLKPLALVHIVGDDQFVGTLEHHFALVQEARNDAGDMAAKPGDGARHGAHQPH